MRKVALLLLLTLCNCAKAPQTLCNYSVAVLERESEKVPYQPYTDVVLFAFFADTLNYHVSSYKEARSGKITNYNTQQQKSYDRAALLKDTVFIAHQITSSPVMLVFCDTVNKIYAYKQNQILAGLDSVFVRLEIEPAQVVEGKTIKKNGWVIKR